MQIRAQSPSEASHSFVYAEYRTVCVSPLAIIQDSTLCISSSERSSLEEKLKTQNLKFSLLKRFWPAWRVECNRPKKRFRQSSYTSHGLTSQSYLHFEAPWVIGPPCNLQRKIISNWKPMPNNMEESTHKEKYTITWYSFQWASSISSEFDKMPCHTHGFAWKDLRDLMGIFRFLI